MEEEQPVWLVMNKEWLERQSFLRTTLAELMLPAQPATKPRKISYIDFLERFIRGLVIT